MSLSRDGAVPTFCTSSSALQPQSLHNLATCETHTAPHPPIARAGPSHHLPLEETHGRHFVINLLPKLLLQPPPGIAHAVHLY